MGSTPILTSFRRASTGKRLWLGGVALGLFLTTLVVGNRFIDDSRAITRRMLGHDFLAFYTAGQFVRDGRITQLYDLGAVRDAEHATAKAARLETGPSFGPWWNPPFYALAFRPLAGLPYATALDLWRWIGVGSLLASIVVLATFVARTPGGREWQAWGLVPLLILISMPFAQALSHAQNTFTSLLVLTAVVACWRAERGTLAGVVAGLLFYKPQLAAVVAAALVLDLGWRPLAGLAVTGTVLLTANLVLLPGTLTDWLTKLPANVHWMQVENTYLWERHVTLKAFWRLLLQGRNPGEPTALTTTLTAASFLLVGGTLAFTLVRGRLRSADLAPADRRLARDRRIAATITATPLLMPFYFDYDLLLLAIPAVLYAAERVGRRDALRRPDGLYTATLILLFEWLYVNPAFALATHVGGTVLLLATASGFAITRAARREAAAKPVLVIRPQPLAVAA